MTQKVACQSNKENQVAKIRVRIIKAPLVNSDELRSVILARAKALVL